MKVGTYNRIVACAENIIQGFESDQTVARRTTSKVWQHILLHNKDTITINSRPRKLVGKSLGCGVYEITIKESK